MDTLSIKLAENDVPRAISRESVERLKRTLGIQIHSQLAHHALAEFRMEGMPNEQAAKELRDLTVEKASECH